MPRWWPCGASRSWLGVGAPIRKQSSQIFFVSKLTWSFVLEDTALGQCASRSLGAIRESCSFGPSVPVAASHEALSSPSFGKRWKPSWTKAERREPFSQVEAWFFESCKVKAPLASRNDLTGTGDLPFCRSTAKLWSPQFSGISKYQILRVIDAGVCGQIAKFAA